MWDKKTVNKDNTMLWPSSLQIVLYSMQNQQQFIVKWTYLRHSFITPERTNRKRTHVVIGNEIKSTILFSSFFHIGIFTFRDPEALLWFDSIFRSFSENGFISKQQLPIDVQTHHLFFIPTWLLHRLPLVSDRNPRSKKTDLYGP